jgi:hypothetical protein
VSGGVFAIVGTDGERLSEDLDTDCGLVTADEPDFVGGIGRGQYGGPRQVMVHIGGRRPGGVPDRGRGVGRQGHRADGAARLDRVAIRVGDDRTITFFPRMVLEVAVSRLTLAGPDSPQSPLLLTAEATFATGRLPPTRADVVAGALVVVQSRAASGVGPVPAGDGSQG